MISVHCLKPLHLYERFLENCDPGFFFLLSAFLTELSLQSASRFTKTFTAQQYLKWIHKRCFFVSAITWLISLVSYITFPIKGGEGKDLLPYVFTFTLPWLESFQAKRLVWNPDPVVWFIHQLVVFWILHPLVRGKLKTFCGYTHHAQAFSFTVLTIFCTIFCFVLTPLVKTGATGWSFHLAPRAFQYVCGFWAARVCVTAREKTLVRAISEEHRTMPSNWYLRFLPDIILIAVISIQNTGTKRYSPEWMALWVWRALGITPLIMIHLTTFGLEHSGGKKGGLWSRSWLVRAFESRWVRRVAPGQLTLFSYLLHFPLVWQFGKGRTERGGHSMIFCLCLWWCSMSMEKLRTKIIQRSGGGN